MCTYTHPSTKWLILMNTQTANIIHTSRERYFYHVRIYLLFLLLILPFLACESLEQNLSPIDPPIIVTIREEMDTINEITLSLRTQKIYPCFNFTIEGFLDLDLDAGEINIWFYGINIPPICATALGPAKWTVNLGALRNGTYRLAFRYHRIESFFDFIVTDSLLKIVGDDTELIIIEQRTVRRIQPDFLWSLIGYTDEDIAQPIIQSFIDDIKSCDADDIELTPGDYVYFKVSEDGTPYYPYRTGYQNYQFDVFQYQQDIQTIKRLVEKYGREYKGLIKITLRTGKGDIFYS